MFLEIIKEEFKLYNISYDIQGKHKIVITFKRCIQYRKIMKSLRLHGVATHYELFPTHDKAVITFLTFEEI